MTTEQSVVEMMQQAEEAPEPGTFNRNMTINSPDEGMPLSVEASSLESAGYVYVYDVRTGDRSLVNRNMLPTQLEKRDEDNERIFTTVKPAIEPPKGTYRCLLHPNDPSRAHYDQMGLARCNKSTLVSEYQVNRHMAVRHRTEWETIQQEQMRAEKDEERAFQRTLMAAIAKSGTPIEAVSVAATVPCEYCGRMFKGASGLRLHIQHKHQEGNDASSTD